MAKNFEFSIIAKFRDLASGKARAFFRNLQGGMRGGLLGGGGFGRMAGRLAARPGGVGGFLSDITQGAAGLLMLPVRLVGAFAGLIPGIGGILSGVVGTAANILSGLIGIAANIAGQMVNTFARVLSKLADVIGNVLGKVLKVGLGIGVGAGALIAWQMFKGIRENMTLADWRQVLSKVFGQGAKAAEEYARTLSLKTPFTPQEMIETVAGLGAARVAYEDFMKTVVDWASGAKRPLEEITSIFQRISSGQFGEALEMARRGLVSARDLMEEGIAFNRGGQALAEPMELLAALARIVEKRFGGMAEAAAKVGTGPLSTWRGIIQDMRVQLSGPWYDKFNNALNNWNTQLLEFATTGSWEKIKKASADAADWVEEKLRGAFDWLLTREWSFDNIKAALASIPHEAGKIWDEIEIVVVNRLKILQIQIELWARQLWQAVGPIIIEGVQMLIKEIVKALTVAVTAIDEKFKTVGGALASPVLAQYQWAMVGVAEALGAASSALEDQQQALKDGKIDAEAYRQEIQRLKDEMKGAAPGIGAAAAGVAGKAFPGKPGGAGVPGPAGAIAGAAAAPSAEEQKLARQISERTYMLKMLERAGQTEAAQRVRAEVLELWRKLDTMLGRVARIQEQTAEDLRSIGVMVEAHEARLRRLGIAR